ncbi:MAG: alpha/beta fold hydrolase [Chitinophagaceae bacterium]
MLKSIYYRGSLLYYRDEGNGSPVFLLHGFGESGSIWKEQVNFLSAYFRMITPDLPGSGSSKMPEALNEFLSMEDYADAINMLLEKENIPVCTLIGHSMGGYITLAFAEKFPEKLNGFGLFHSTAMADSMEKKTAREKSISFIQSHGPKAFLDEAIPNLYGAAYRALNPEDIVKHVEESGNISATTLISYYQAMIQRPDRKEVLQNFPKPVLFIMGEEDKAVNLREALTQCHLPRESHVHIWKAVAHMGMRETPEKTNHTLLAYLQHVNENKFE